MSLVLAEEQETLDLQGQDLGRKGAQRLARALLPHQSLRELNLACTKLTDAGIAYVAGALQRNVSLVSVNLRNNELGDVGTEALASALSCAWKENESYQLVELNLSGNLFSDLGLQAFGEVLGSGCPLKLLELSHLKMVTVEGWELFVGYLGESRLETLKLRQNGAFGATAAQRLATALAQEGRMALDSLDLCRCGLSSSAGACLAAALQAAPELTVLHLDRNAFGFQGAIDLAKALRVPQCRLQAGADAPGGPAGRWRRRSPRRGRGAPFPSAQVGDLGATSLGLMLKKAVRCRLQLLGLNTNLIGPWAKHGRSRGRERCQVSASCELTLLQAKDLLGYLDATGDGRVGMEEFRHFMSTSNLDMTDPQTFLWSPTTSFRQRMGYPRAQEEDPWGFFSEAEAPSTEFSRSMDDSKRRNSVKKSGKTHRRKHDACMVPLPSNMLRQLKPGDTLATLHYMLDIKDPEKPRTSENQRSETHESSKTSAGMLESQRGLGRSGCWVM
eukprot:g2247.t1